MTEIIDIIKHRNKYGTQIFLVVDTPVSIKYERAGDLLVGEDSGFFNFYIKRQPTKHFQAFAGREFDIPLANGGVEKAHGQWWDHLPSDYEGLVYSLGVSSLCELEKCYVFYSTKVDKKLVDEWLSKNDASNNYRKYDKTSNDYGKHRIVSPWEYLETTP